MDIKGIIQGNKDLKKKYKYYSSLGYREIVCEILSVLSYGDEELGKLIDKQGKGNIFDGLEKWLSEQNGKDPKEAVFEYIRKINEKNTDRRSTGPLSLGRAPSRNPILRRMNLLGSILSETDEVFYDEEDLLKLF